MRYRRIFVVMAIAVVVLVSFTVFYFLHLDYGNSLVMNTSTHVTVGVVQWIVVMGVLLFSVTLSFTAWIHHHLLMQASRLAQNQKRYEALIEHNPAMIATLSIEGKIVSINSSMERETGYMSQDLVGLSFLSLVNLSDYEQVSEWLENAAQGEHQQFILGIHHSDGRSMTLGAKAVPILLGKRTSGVFIIALDITEIKANEQMILELRRQRELILQSAGEGICGVDPAGKIIFANPLASEITGYGADELVGRPVYRLLCHAHDPDESEQGLCSECPIFKSLQDGVVHHVSGHQFWRKDGASVPIDFVSAPMIDDGEIQGAVIVFKDVSARIQQEEFLRRTDRLAVAGQLAAAVAHEIRNPLTALRGFVQLMQGGAAKPDYLNIMDGELRRIESIIQEFLLLAKPQYGTYNELRIGDLIKSVIMLFELQGLMNHVEIISMIEDGLGPIRCMQNQIKQVFINLLQNAMDAMPDGGVIRITARSDEDSYILVSVSDDGVGIPSDRLDKLGEPFYTTKDKGTGLGLMISYKILEDHGGSIRFISAVGQGTTVEVRLPMIAKSVAVITS